MSNIRYICLSDMHLGQANSLLTKLNEDCLDIDTSEPGEFMKLLCTCLRSIVAEINSPDASKPILILNGDILELALSTLSNASMVFEHFINLLMPEGDELFEQIIYLPGNHDHHIWEIARETQYAKQIEKIPAGQKLDEMCHKTNMFELNIPSYYLNTLLKRYKHLKKLYDNNQFDVKVVYPNFGLIKDNKCVIFHHGHFIDDTYKLISKFMSMIFPDRQDPENIQTIEEENFAWIDFLWSTLGSAGDAGKLLDTVYQGLKYDEKQKILISNLSDSLTRQYNLPFLIHFAEDKFYKAIMKRLCKIVKTDSCKEEEHQHLDEKLLTYIQGPLINQLKEDLPTQLKIPEDITFIFGHTHKPCEEILKTDNSIKIYNSGGWVIENRGANTDKGAAIVLLDEELNTTSIRIYNECDDNEVHFEKARVFVSDALNCDDVNNSFHIKIQNAVKQNYSLWSKFTFEFIKERDKKIKHINKSLEYISLKNKSAK